MSKIRDQVRKSTTINFPDGFYERFQQVCDARGVRYSFAIIQAMTEWMEQVTGSELEELQRSIQAGRPSAALVRGASVAEAVGEDLNPVEAEIVRKVIFVLRHGTRDQRLGMEISINCFEECSAIRGRRG